MSGTNNGHDAAGIDGPATDGGPLVDDRHPSERLKLIGLDSQIVLEFAASPPPMQIHAELDPPPEVELR